MALLYAILASCAQAPDQSNRSGLNLRFPAQRGARAAYSFEAVNVWRIAGTSSGPGFAQDFPGTATSARIVDLYPGEWVVTVDGLDAAEKALFTAKQTVTLVEGVNTINMTMEPVVVAVPSSNADLASIMLSKGMIFPSFSASVLEYSASVPNSTASLTVTATPAHDKATVAYGVAMPATLTVGLNSISITVTAEDKTTKKIYALAVTRANPPDISVMGKLNYYDSVPVTLTNGSTINFSEVYGTPLTMSFTVQNYGTGDLHPVLSISNAQDPNAYKLPAPTIPPIIPGSSYNFDVVYSRPTAVFVNPQTGTLTITSDDPDTATFILNLTGTYC
jgi:hypothetical protein